MEQTFKFKYVSNKGPTHSKGSSTPRRTTTDLGVVGEDSEGGLVSKRNVDDTVVSEGAQSGNSSALLSTTLGSGANEETSVFTPVSTSAPLLSGGVPYISD